MSNANSFYEQAANNSGGNSGNFNYFNPGNNANGAANNQQPSANGSQDYMSFSGGPNYDHGYPAYCI